MTVGVAVAVGEPLVRTIADPVRSSLVAFVASLTVIGALAGLAAGLSRRSGLASSGPAPDASRGRGAWGDHRRCGRSGHVWLRDGDRVILAVVIADTDSFVGRQRALEEFAAEEVEEVWFVTTRRELLDVYRDRHRGGSPRRYRVSGRYLSTEPIVIDGLTCALDPGDLHRHPRPIADRCIDRR